MIILVIALSVMATGILVTGLLTIAVMLHSGKWTLPGTSQRRVQHAKTMAEVARFRVEEERLFLERDIVAFDRELNQHRFGDQLDQLYEARKQKELGQ